MIENRCLVELAGNNPFKGSAKMPGKFLEEWDNASAWFGWFWGENYWLDTHIYTHKQIYERVMKAVAEQEKRHKEWLRKQEDDENGI